jgi:hypothetical protein
MRTRKPARSKVEVRVDPAELRLTAKQLVALKKGFKNLLVTTLGARSGPLVTCWHRATKRRVATKT